MPEEINRVMTDAISDYLFTTCRDADENLKHEGVPENRVFLVGNVMIDSLVSATSQIKKSTILDEIGLCSREYMYITLHRPSNVDDKSTLLAILNSLEQLSIKQLRMVFPIHPRTKKMLQQFQLLDFAQSIEGLEITDPIGYLDSLALMNNSRLVLTDSGGVQEETTYLGIPCLTLRPSTERPITITEGTNILLDKGPEMIVPEVEEILSGAVKDGGIPELWDGKTAHRIVGVLISSL